MIFELVTNNLEIEGHNYFVGTNSKYNHTVPIMGIY